MSGLISKREPWHPITEREPAHDTDPRSKPIDFTLTPAELDIARRAMVDVLAMQRRSSFGQATAPGLDISELKLADLTPAEVAALGVAA